ncbi:hypothetical protein KC726_05245 [Candidatus Woesebacteria bacterium]|nr:hypothetical protein [Candidatus Woesebacteria bacterium]
MKSATPINKKRLGNAYRNDSLEREKEGGVGGTLSSLGKDTVSAISDTLSDIGTGMFDQLIGNQSAGHEMTDLEKFEKEFLPEAESKKTSHRINGERGNLFSYRMIEEDRQIEAISQRIGEIKQQTKAIRRADKQFMGEVNRIDKVVNQINPSEENNEYTIHFLDLIIDTLKHILKRVQDLGKSNTWMEAMMTKKSKRGSLFAARSKKKGTQYSMSKELSLTRQTQ